MHHLDLAAAQLLRRTCSSPCLSVKWLITTDSVKASSFSVEQGKMSMFSTLGLLLRVLVSKENQFANLRFLNFPELQITNLEKIYPRAMRNVVLEEWKSCSYILQEFWSPVSREKVLLCTQKRELESHIWIQGVWCVLDEQTGGRRKKRFITSANAASQHLLTPFSSTIFELKLLYDHGFCCSQKVLLCTEKRRLESSLNIGTNRWTKQRACRNCL